MTSNCTHDASHQVDVTQVVDPEGVQSRCDRVELVGLQRLLALDYGAVESGADPAIHAAERSRLQQIHKHSCR